MSLMPQNHQHESPLLVSDHLIQLQFFPAAVTDVNPVLFFLESSICSSSELLLSEITYISHKEDYLFTI